MYRAEIYVIDPASLAQHHFAAALIFGVVALASLGLVARFGRRSWWVVTAVVIAVPTLIAITLGGALPGPNWPLTQFFGDVVIPLSTISLPSAAIGSAVGAAVRWLIGRNKRPV